MRFIPHSATWRARCERGMFSQDGPSSAEVLDTDCRFLWGIALAALCLRKQKRGWIQAVSPVRDGSIVAEAATAGGFWTIRVGKRKSARTGLAAKRGATLRRIGLRRIRSRRAIAAIRLGVRHFHPKGHGQNAHACENA